MYWILAVWWKLFDRVLARKRGASDPVGSKPLTAVLRCSSCGQVDWARKPGALLCNRCGRELAVAGLKIVLN